MIIKIIKGFLLGIISNSIGIYLYTYFFSRHSVEYTLQAAAEQGFMGGVIGIGAVLNLVLFFFFLTSRIGKFKKQPQPYEARGVLMATVLAALAVLYFEF